MVLLVQLELLEPLGQQAQLELLVQQVLLVTQFSVEQQTQQPKVLMVIFILIQQVIKFLDQRLQEFGPLESTLLVLQDLLDLRVLLDQ
jgi:hypothetical protein